jgi:fluoroacetyl-CoA thioesterase
MNELIKAGLTHKETKTVKFEDTAASYGSGFMEVFATPALIALMEYTSLMVVQPYMESGYGTVGIHVNITHLRAAPVGNEVECLATLTEVNENSLTFSVVALNQNGKIGEGTHSRFIIDEARFMKKFQKGMTQ